MRRATPLAGFNFDRILILRLQPEAAGFAESNPDVADRIL